MTQVADDVKLGKISRQWNDLFRRVREGTLDADKVSVALQEVIESKFLLNPAYRVTVNYDQPVADAIAAGEYNWVNSDIIQKNFPTNRTGKTECEIELVHFNRVVSTKEALAELDKRGLRPAELHELLALGAEHPKLQREFPIIGLGSVWRSSSGGRGCPYLLGSGSKRGLGLRWVEDGWGGSCRFAAVRK